MTDRLPPGLAPDHPLFGLGYAEPVREREFTRLEGGQRGERAAVAEEVPIAFIYNGRPHVVMMGTPADLEDFAVGFSLTEEIVAAASEISRLEVVKHAQGIELQLTIPDDAARRLETRGRPRGGETGCGLCGVETVAEALRPPRRLPAGRPPVARHALWRAEAMLPELQEWNRETGALHAAAWVSDAGAPEVVREDVGRHNALDKVIGALARSGRRGGRGVPAGDEPGELRDGPEGHRRGGAAPGRRFPPDRVGGAVGRGERADAGGAAAGADRERLRAPGGSYRPGLDPVICFIRSFRSSSACRRCSLRQSL